jgi:hypothetical protein
MKAWVKRRWPTLVVAVATVYGLISIVILYFFNETFLARLVAVPGLFGLFPFGFLFFFADILPGGGAGVVLTVCFALFTLAVIDEVDRRSRRGGLVAVAVYLGLCLYVATQRDSIWLWGTAMRRVCYACGHPL